MWSTTPFDREVCSQRTESILLYARLLNQAALMNSWTCLKDMTSYIKRSELYDTNPPRFITEKQSIFKCGSACPIDVKHLMV